MLACLLLALLFGIAVAIAVPVSRQRNAARDAAAAPAAAAAKSARGAPLTFRVDVAVPPDEEDDAAGPLCGSLFSRAQDSSQSVEVSRSCASAEGVVGLYLVALLCFKRTRLCVHDASDQSWRSCWCMQERRQCAFTCSVKVTKFTVASAADCSTPSQLPKFQRSW
jgi:hypothetical protein